ncbi:creatininase family protein [Cytobacillus firmus]|uniref:creatininase family protein n=1 Tax=Cytobacillus firmus TaxID=1399 RepID=UPI001C8EF085|nr:creatininase family protein [Cytobacillus firmus]MBX9976596.1 creatininase family protein [Cytobacillus firmus]
MINYYSGELRSKRFLARLTSTQINELNKLDSLVILPIGAMEQHGPHLPVFTDTLLAETLLENAFNYISEDANIWVLPPLPYGKSNEHCGRPGTVSLSSSTLQSIVMDIGKSIKQSGFKRLVLFNAHGGNHDLLNLMAREVRLETDLMVFRVNVGSLEIDESLISEQESVLGIHGGDYETSMILASYPEWVNIGEVVGEYPNLSDYSEYLSFQKGNFAWTINDMSSTGILGDARSATKEKGKILYESQGKQLAKILMVMKEFEIEDIKNTQYYSVKNKDIKG